MATILDSKTAETYDSVLRLQRACCLLEVMKSCQTEASTLKAVQ